MRLRKNSTRSAITGFTLGSNREHEHGIEAFRIASERNVTIRFSTDDQFSQTAGEGRPNSGLRPSTSMAATISLICAVGLVASCKTRCLALGYPLGLFLNGLQDESMRALARPFSGLAYTLLEVFRQANGGRRHDYSPEAAAKVAQLWYGFLSKRKPCRSAPGSIPNIHSHGILTLDYLERTVLKFRRAEHVGVVGLNRP